MSAVRYLDTDVLVIGGGLAGARTALETHAAGLKTLVVVKGLLGKSGSSIFAGNLDFFAAPEHESPPDPAALEAERQEAVRRTMEFLAKYTHYLGDQEYMLAASEYHQTDFFPWIEARGYYVLRDERGAIVTDVPHRTQAWGVQMGLSGTVLMDLMRKLVLSAQIQLLEQTAVTRLLKKDGQVVGAVALDFLHGQLYVIRAKVVVLATGHSNFLFRRATGTREGSASGWVMAYEAGASLQNIEMQWYHVSDVAYPAAWMRLHLYPNPLPGTTHRSRLYNREGELFFDGNWFPDNPVPYIMQLKHLVRQVVAGKARWDGDYYSSYTHVEPQVLEKYIYQTHFLEKIGVDLKTQVMENGVTWHMNVGGIRVDGGTMESGVPGLLVAGSVSALVTGGLPNVMYDGIVAARSAVERARRQPLLDLDATQVEAEVRRVTALFRTQPADGLLPGQVKHKIRELAWEHLNYLKTESSLQAALDGLLKIEAEDLPRMRLQTDTLQFNSDWQDALDAIDMLQALKLLTQFSLHRKESRGGFYRQDYPLTDNQRWLVHIVGDRRENGDLELRELPVNLPYASPAQAVADYFELDY